MVQFRIFRKLKNFQFQKFLTKIWMKIGLEIKNYFHDFCGKTSFHGFRHLASKRMSSSEKLIWTGILGIATGIFVFLIQRAVQRMLDESILIELESVDNSMEELDFPAVTVCNHNRIYKPSAEKFMKYLNNSGYTENNIQEFFHYLPILTNPLENVFLKSNLYNRMLQDLKIPLKSLMQQLMHPCENLFGACEFVGILVNCSSLFKPVLSYKGFCCAFNYHVSPIIFNNNKLENCTNLHKNLLDSNFTCKKETDCPGRKRIQKVRGSGIHTGLYFRLYIEPENYFGLTENFASASLIIHETHDYPELDISELVVQQSKQVNVIISGIKVENDITIHQLSQETRDCVFSSEVPYDYSFQSCIASCKIKRLLKICSCVPYYYLDTCVNISKTCDFSNMKCIRKNHALIYNIHEKMKLENGEILEKCPCLQVCSRTKYVIYDEIASIYQGLRYPFLERLAQSKRGSDFGFAKVYVYFQDYTFTKFKKRLSSPWYTTIGILGSILGLCLGGSFISVLEPIIQIFVTPCRIIHREKQKNKIESNKKIFKKIPLNDRIKKIKTLSVNRDISMLQIDY